MLVALMLLAAQVQAQSPIAKLVVQPGLKLTMPAQDTMRIVATAVDAEGKAVPGAIVRFFGQGGRFEGEVDSTGLVRSGSTGTMTVTAVGRVPGGRPVSERIEVQMVAGPAARVEVSPAVATLAAGQRIRLEATAFSKAGDRRYAPFAWTSSAPKVATVRSDGQLTAVGAGEAIITAKEPSGSDVTGTLRVRVVATPVAAVDITPAMKDAKQGDVIRFQAVARDAPGKEIAGLTPQWTLSPGQGMIDADGAFVGYEAGTYTVTASYRQSQQRRDGDARAARCAPSRDGRRPAAAHALPHRRSLDPPQRQERLPRLAAAAAT